MRALRTGLLMVAFSSAPASAGAPLAAYMGSARVLVVSAPHENDPELGRQMAALSRAGAQLRERDLVVVRVEGSMARDDRGASLEAAAVREVLAMPADRFEVVLVGKDGGAKLRSVTAIPIANLLGTIDAMPMRRNEMRKTP